MKWNRFTIKTKTDAEDLVISALADVGVEGVEIQDRQPLTEEDKAQMFVDIMPEGQADDGIAYLSFYLEEDADRKNILKSSGVTFQKLNHNELSDNHHLQMSIYYPINPVHPYNGQTENHLIMLIPICAKTSGAANNNRAKNRV